MLLVIAGLAVVGSIAAVVIGVLVFAAATISDDEADGGAVVAPAKAATAPAPAPTVDEVPSKEAPATAPAAPAAPKSGGTTWICNATGWVRVCGFANVCSNQLVSGIGSGPTQVSGSMMAKTACENMARARGGATVCTVACTPKTR